MYRPCVLLLAVAACQPTTPESVQAPPDSASGEVAFELAGPNGAALVVPVIINGTDTVDFVLDTGATMTCIDGALADSLDLPPMTGAVGFGAGVGGGGQIRLVQFESLRVGAASATDLPGCALDLAHVQELGVKVHGLLGLNFLRSFRVTIDFDRSLVRLE